MKSLSTLLWLLLASLALHAATVVRPREPRPDRSAAGNSFQPTLTRDGRHVVFLSHAMNLVTNATDLRGLNIYSHDLISGETFLVSAGIADAGANSACAWPVASSNGQFIAFATDAGNLVPGDTNGVLDVFVRDLAAHRTTLVSADANGHCVNGPQTSSGNPMITADGRYVFFESNASNLVSDIDTNGLTDVFRTDLWSNTTVLVSKSTAASANGATALASITPNGSMAALISTATDLGETNSSTEVYVWNAALGTLSHASPFATFFTNAYRCVDAVLSENGKYALITVTASNYSPTLFRRELETSSTILIASNLSLTASPQISSDGRFIAFEDGTNAYRWEAASGTAAAVNVTTAGEIPAARVSGNAHMTSDGKFVIFASDSAGLTPTGQSGKSQLYARDMETGVTHLITATPDGSASAGDHELSRIGVSDDLSIVVFDSCADDLVAGDTNGRSDVFARLGLTNTTLVGSRLAGLPGSHTKPGRPTLNSSSISADGRFVAFASSMPEETDTNLFRDVYLADTATGDIVRCGAESVPIRSFAISGNGRYVLQARSEMRAPNEDLYRFDRQTRSNRWIARIAFSPLTQLPTVPVISFDGSLVAYQSSNTVQLLNVETGNLEFVTNGPSALMQNGEFRAGIFTPDSRYLLFVRQSLTAWDRQEQKARTEPYWISELANVAANSAFAVTGPYITRWNLRDESLWLNLPMHEAAISGDGRFIVGSTSNHLSVPNFKPQILLWDVQTGQTNTISTSRSGELGNGKSTMPVISADGRFVAYLTEASNIVDGNSNQTRQVLLKDRLLGTTVPLSAGPAGALGNSHSGKPVLSLDGRTLIFQSMADNLIPGDYNESRDVFMVKLGGLDSDGDGMDDDWEIAYFGDLSRSGAGDFDGDGVPDRDEFLAGTDPTDSGSVFRVIAMTSVTGQGKRLIWSGTATRNYRVEFKDDINAPTWSPLNTSASFNGSTATAVDSSNATNRFYRVVRLP